MKKLKINYIALSLILVLSMTTNIFADFVGYKDFGIEENTDIHREWKIAFNDNINPQSIKNGQIRVIRDGDKTTVDNPQPIVNGSLVILNPPEDGYDYDTEYTLIVEGVKSLKGKDLIQPAKKQFRTEKYKAINPLDQANIRGIFIGQSESSLISKLGHPNRKDLSEYGFKWYVYNGDYSRYIQVGLANKKVVAIYSNLDSLDYKTGISIGMSREDVEKLLGEPLAWILKGNTRYLVTKSEGTGLYFVDNMYITVFYDMHRGNIVTAIQVIEEDTEMGLPGRYGDYGQELRDSFELQMFDLVNAIRVRNGLSVLKWDEKARISARGHSQDMADKNYFSHTNLQGKSPFDRMKAERIDYKMAGENLAAGLASSIYSHESLMNSFSGHRETILKPEYEFLGVGVGYNSNSNYKYYYTQNYFTGW